MTHLHILNLQAIGCYGHQHSMDVQERAIWLKSWEKNGKDGSKSKYSISLNATAKQKCLKIGDMKDVDPDELPVFTSVRPVQGSGLQHPVLHVVNSFWIQVTTQYYTLRPQRNSRHDCSVYWKQILFYLMNDINEVYALGSRQQG